MYSHSQLRQKIQSFWTDKGHVDIPPASLVLTDDATTLFTSAGMQQLVPYLKGEAHPQGTRLFDIQPCLRTQDIDEIGDNRHTTLFEMIGNWSLGDYFKEKQLPWVWQLFTEELHLPSERLFVTIFEGDGSVPADEESRKIWKDLGVDDSHIFSYSAKKNWWSRAGTPDQMPVGEIGGPSSEIFYDFGVELHLHENSRFKNDDCHPNCDCGRFMEIGNSVFIQYEKTAQGLQEMKQKNVDFGGGLERILAAIDNTPDIFETDVFTRPMNVLSDSSLTIENKRIIADHMRAAVFLLKAGIAPSNKQQGYILRRMIRRSAVKMYQLQESLEDMKKLLAVAESVKETFVGVYFTPDDDFGVEIQSELDKFSKTLKEGLRRVAKLETITGEIAFDLYQSYGFPFELTQEIAADKGLYIEQEDFQKALVSHQQKSRTASAGMFKGGLADTSGQVVKYHTATHLIHQALTDILGDSVQQEGSNITQDRLRFDFSFDRKMTDEEIVRVQEVVNEKIQENLPVSFKILPKEEAEKLGAKSFFRDKYGSEVKVYFIGDYSKEFCGGPHVAATGEIGSIEVYKVEKTGAQHLRLYAR